MAKRTQKEDEDMELNLVKESLARLEKRVEDQLELQEKTTQEILVLLRGSISMGVVGILGEYKELRAQVGKITGDLAHYERWRQMQIQNKGKITISIGQIFTRILAVIGGVGSLIGVILAIKELVGK